MIKTKMAALLGAPFFLSLAFSLALANESPDRAKMNQLQQKLQIDTKQVKADQQKLTQDREQVRQDRMEMMRMHQDMMRYRMERKKNLQKNTSDKKTTKPIEVPATEENS